MPENQFNGRSLTALAKDVAEGFVVINPSLLKRIGSERLKDLYQYLRRTQRDLRAKTFPTADILAIRKRNTRLQRLHQATTVVEFSAKEKRIPLL
jgi:hypothetical protein